MPISSQPDVVRKTKMVTARRIAAAIGPSPTMITRSLESSSDYCFNTCCTARTRES